MPTLLHWCSFEYARDAGATEIHIYPDGQPTVPFPESRAALEALIRKAHNDPNWRRFNRFAPEGGVIVRSMDPFQVCIGAMEHGEEQRIG